MKYSIFGILFSLILFSCCSNSAATDVLNLSDPVITDEEVSGPFGDENFVSLVNDILSNTSLETRGQTYYISTDGSDSNDGSQSAPFESFSYALEKLTAGDTLYVKGGTYTEQIEITSKSGQEDSYITIAADPENAESNPAIISGSELTDDDDYRLVFIEKSSYIRISGITFTNSYGLDAAGIIVKGESNHLIFDNCTFTNIKVPDPAKEDHVANGILCYGDSPSTSGTINNILIYNNSFTNMATGWGECLSVVANCENVNIIKNTIDTTGNIGIDVGGNYGYCSTPSLDFTRYAYIAQNQVSNCESAYGDTSYGIYADGGQHIQIVNNTATACSGGIEVGAEEAQKSVNYATYDVLIKGNSVSESTDCALAIGGYEAGLGMVRTVLVTGNTFTNNADKEDGAIISISKCDSVIISGNTFTHTDGVFDGTFLEYALGQKYSTNVEVSDSLTE